MCDVELRYAVVDLGSLLIIISLSTLEAMVTPRDRIVKQPVKVSGFGGDTSFTLDFINLDLF